MGRTEWGAIVMEKVKLTQEQAAFVEEWKSIKTGFENVVRALTEGYEIEPEQPEFQQGDKVFLQSGDSVPRILTLRESDKPFQSEWTIQESLGCIHERYFRHATPEEIYWLETLGREKVGDYQYGDILTSPDHTPFVIANKTDVEAGFLDKGYADEFRLRLNLKGLLPAESFKPFPKEAVK